MPCLLKRVCSLSELHKTLFFCCCSNAFKKFFHPVLDEIADGRSSTANQFTVDGYLETFQRLLYKSADPKMRTDGFILKLQEGLQSLIVQVANQFSIQRREVNNYSLRI